MGSYRAVALTGKIPCLPFLSDLEHCVGRCAVCVIPPRLSSRALVGHYLWQDSPHEGESAYSETDIGCALPDLWCK